MSNPSSSGEQARITPSLFRMLRTFWDRMSSPSPSCRWCLLGPSSVCTASPGPGFSSTSPDRISRVTFHVDSLFVECCTRDQKNLGAMPDASVIVLATGTGLGGNNSPLPAKLLASRPSRRTKHEALAQAESRTWRARVRDSLAALQATPAHCGTASQFRANLIARATFKNLLAIWLNASEIV